MALVPRLPRSPGSRRLAGLLAAVALAAAALPAAAPAATRPDVVVVVFDEFPVTSLQNARGGIDAGRFPNFAALAAGATWFRRTTAAHDHTTRALPAILTGERPRRGPRPGYTNEPHSLFTLLGPRWRMDVREQVDPLCPPRLCGLHRLDIGLLLGGWRPQRFSAWLRTIAAHRPPTLYFIHVLLPHVPWQYLPSGDKYRRHAVDVLPDLDGPAGFGDPWLVEQSWQRHLLQVGFVDRLLGMLLARLRATGLYDRALLVVTADHGMAFHRFHDRRILTPAVVQDIAPVPLFVRRPGQRRGAISDRHVETIDVLPTIADALHLRLPWHVDGASALRPPAPRRARQVEIVPRTGGVLRISVAELYRRQAAERRRQVELFGQGSWDPLYRIGPHRELLGRPAAPLTSRARSRLRATLALGRELAAVRPRTGYLPVDLAGRLLGGAPGARRDLAAAVNGRIWAVGRSFRLAGHGDEYFSMMVPDAALRPGRNRVAIYAVRAGQAPLLRLGPG